MESTASGCLTAMELARELQVPVKFIGVGEGMEDLKPFDAEAYVRELV